MKVDNVTNVTAGDMRNSVRITTQDFYDYGSVWIIDLLHIPYGCSVWPAFWSKGPLWPNDGEIGKYVSRSVQPATDALQTSSRPSIS